MIQFLVAGSGEIVGLLAQHCIGYEGAAPSRGTRRCSPHEGLGRAWGDLISWADTTLQHIEKAWVHFLDHNPLDLVEGDDVGRPVIELCHTRALVCRPQYSQLTVSTACCPRDARYSVAQTPERDHHGPH
jgi:hypothetical protein